MGAISGRRIPEATVARLPEYLRVLTEAHEVGVDGISSEELADLAGVNATKVRKDLSHLGTYGVRGVGYDVQFLIFQIRRELGLDHDWPIVIVGAGNLGQALAGFAGFRERGFDVVGIVDVDPGKLGLAIGGVTVRAMSDLPDIVTEHHITIGVLAIPPAAAQVAADQLVAAGVTSILNFAPVLLNLPAGVTARKVDLAVELQILSYYEQRRLSDARRPPAVSGRRARNER